MARTIEEISAEIVAHKSAGCEFEPCATCNRMVPGSGDPHAALMLIGEAPGRNEDEQGVPFVGAAGKLLDDLLGSVSLTREQVFIANVLKARPPGNRDPSPEEAAHHWPWLAEQIEAVSPDVIVLLGRHAMERFLPGRRISAIHGQARLKDGQVYLPVYHPAAALYNGGLRETVFADFAQLPELVARVQAAGREELRARSGLIDGLADGVGGGGPDLAAEFADASEVAVTAPGGASFADDYADPLDGMEAARMMPPPFETPVTRDDPPRPAPGQPGLF